VPVNPIKWALSLAREGPVTAFGAGFFDDSADVPGQPVLHFSLRGKWDAEAGTVELTKVYDSALVPADMLVHYQGRVSLSEGRPALTGTWRNTLHETHGAFACRLMEET